MKDFPKKKVLICHASLVHMAGTEQAMICLLNAIDYDKYDVTLLMLDGDGAWRARVPSGVCVKVFNHLPLVYRAFLRLKNPFKWGGDYLWRAYIKLINYLYVKKHTQLELCAFLLQKSEICPEEYDLACDFYGYGYFFTGYIAKRIKAKHKALWIHSDPIPAPDFIETYGKYYDRFFCVSNAVKTKFDNLFPKYAKNSQVFYNIISPDNIRRLAEDKIKNDVFLNCKHLKIVTVGRLTGQKGIDIAINTAAYLKNHHIDFNWFFIGAGNMDKYLKLIHDLGLEENCFLMGGMENPLPYVKSSDLYVQPSRFEGYGLSLLEARILGKLIVASDIPAFREQVSNGEDGILVQCNSVDYENAIERVLSDPVFRCRIGKCAQINSCKISFDQEILKFYSLFE